MSEDFLVQTSIREEPEHTTKRKDSGLIRSIIMFILACIIGVQQIQVFRYMRLYRDALEHNRLNQTNQIINEQLSGAFCFYEMKTPKFSQVKCIRSAADGRSVHIVEFYTSEVDRNIVEDRD